MTRLLHRCAPIHSSALAQLVNKRPMPTSDAGP